MLLSLSGQKHILRTKFGKCLHWSIANFIFCNSSWWIIQYEEILKYSRYWVANSDSLWLIPTWIVLSLVLLSFYLFWDIPWKFCSIGELKILSLGIIGQFYFIFNFQIYLFLSFIECFCFDHNFKFYFLITLDIPY